MYISLRLFELHYSKAVRPFFIVPKDGFEPPISQLIYYNCPLPLELFRHSDKAYCLYLGNLNDELQVSGIPRHMKKANRIVMTVDKP